MKKQFKTLKISFLLTTLSVAFYSVQAQAVTCYVNGSAPISSQVMPALGTVNGNLTAIQATLINIGTAITQQGDRTAVLIDQAFKKQQEFAISQKKQDRQKEVVDKYKIPDDICGSSISSGMSSVSNTAKSGSGGTSLAGSSTNKDVRNAYLSPLKSVDIDVANTATSHRNYCSEADMVAYGGTKFCEVKSDMPNGDTSLESVLIGAGKPNKNPDLTFSDEQVDAALLYVKNTTGRSAGRAPSKGEVKSASGRVYLGLLKQYEAYRDASQQPMLEMIAESKPNPQTIKPVQDALKVPSMKYYYEQTISNTGKSKGLSLREFQDFEVNRRYSNTAYQADLATKSDIELMKEQVMIANLNNYLLLENNRKLDKQNILLGQLLSLEAYAQYKDMLDGKVNQLNQAVSAN
ncbi:conjugal transfer protein TraW [Proteus mirabilis]|uniref:conjugal transfer protein TraW n=1 Tax=Proteus mirabilis TaxID=584 RepID=UPI00214F6AC0|nr:conjugal transfer protein TraW [Proteus mirabilis]MCS6722134.1 conjugal transfer protein TraW [Proteus mirabilis]MCS6727801.1 conjugal transfer protein TraW [Proteus mirabilis]MCS6748743.1 conjugal transfer protein TraW [Proteus mirabilis]